MKRQELYLRDCLRGVANDLRHNRMSRWTHDDWAAACAAIDLAGTYLERVGDLPQRWEHLADEYDYSVTEKMILRKNADDVRKAIRSK